MFDQQVDNLIGDYVENLDEFCASLQKIAIRKEILRKRTILMGTLNLYANLNQCRKFCLRLISSLIDGTYDSNEYGQEAVTVAQLITSHASR